MTLFALDGVWGTPAILSISFGRRVLLPWTVFICCRTAMWVSVSGVRAVVLQGVGFVNNLNVTLDLSFSVFYTFFLLLIVLVIMYMLVIVLMLVLVLVILLVYLLIMVLLRVWLLLLLLIVPRFEYFGSMSPNKVTITVLALIIGAVF